LLTPPTPTRVPYTTLFRSLKLLYKIRPEERQLPSATELATLREGERYEEVMRRVTEEPRGEFRSLARRVWQSPEGERVLGMLLQDRKSTRLNSSHVKISYA